MDTEQNLNTGDSPVTESKVEVGNVNDEETPGNKATSTPKKESKVEVGSVNDEETPNNKATSTPNGVKDEIEIGGETFTLLMSDDNVNDDDSSNEGMALFGDPVENPLQQNIPEEEVVQRTSISKSDNAKDDVSSNEGLALVGDQVENPSQQNIPKKVEQHTLVSKSDASASSDSDGYLAEAIDSLIDSYNPKEPTSTDKTNSPTLLHEKVHISEAARKRLRKSREGNINASTSTVVPDNESHYSDDSDAPETSEANEAKLAKSDKVMVGILPSDFPKSSFTVDQLMAVQEAILDLIIEKRKVLETKPRFIFIRKRGGWLELLCANKATYQWLKDIQNEVIPWEGASIKVVPGNQLPHVQTLTVKLPGSASYSNEKILGLIEAQNEGLDVTYWRIISRSVIKTERDAHLEVLLSIDNKSFKTVKKADFRIGYKFGHVQLHTKRSLAERAQHLKAKREQKQIARDSRYEKPQGQPWQMKTPKQQGQPWQAGPSKQQGGTSKQQGKPWHVGIPEQQGQPWGKQRQRVRKKKYGQFTPETPSGQHGQLGQEKQSVKTPKAANTGPFNWTAPGSSGQHNRKMDTSGVPPRLYVPKHQLNTKRGNEQLGSNPSSSNSQNRLNFVWENQPFKTYRSPFQ